MSARRVASPSAVLRDRRGATIVEFAIILPVMMMLIMGLGEMLYQEYIQAVLNGAVQKAGRDSGIQGGADQTGTIDASVIGMIGSVLPVPTQNCSGQNTTIATYCSTRENYDTFTEVAPEPFNDTNGNGKCDAGESYSDENGNQQWDADPGISGQGGANDVTLYSMVLTYPRFFPVAALLGFSNTATLTSSTLLKNQPYAAQTITTIVQRTCP